MNMSNNKEFFLNLFLLLAYCGLIFYVSSLEGKVSKPALLFPGEDKVVHMLEYGVLGILLMRCLLSWKESAANLGIAIFIGTLYGMSDEYHQSFVPGRYVEAEDVLADFIGVTLASILYMKRQGKVGALNIKRNY